MDCTKIVLPCSVKTSILALGAHSKSAFCFAKGNIAYLSGTGGDLGELDNLKKFESGIKKLQKKIKAKPEIIACDLHPEYVSTKYAYDLVRGEGLRAKAIQHHEAHIASCLADNNVKGRVIGVAFDGTGYGSDGNIWGGEFFIGGLKGLKRAAHLRYVPMPGGEASIREPWRMGFSYLYNAYKGNLRLAAIGGLAMTGRKWPRNDNLKFLIEALDKRINSPLTSSMGRLFDGVSALIGVCDFAGYEGEAAIKLEKIIPAEGSRFKAQWKYSFGYAKKDGIIIIDWGPLIKGVIKDLENGVRKPEISTKFHNAVCEMIKDVCRFLRKKYKIKKVCLSGGVFQNRYLSSSIRPVLEKDGFDVYMHKTVPAHDGGIALGQAVLACQRLHF